jgi:hypothetical protein
MPAVGQTKREILAKALLEEFRWDAKAASAFLAEIATTERPQEQVMSNTNTNSSISAPKQHNPEGNSCHMCAKKARMRCSSCKRAYYCSGNCQRSHWSEHKTVCRHEQGKSPIKLASDTGANSKPPVVFNHSNNSLVVMGRADGTPFDVHVHAQQLVHNGYTVIDGFASMACARKLLHSLSGSPLNNPSGEFEDNVRDWQSKGFEIGLIAGGVVGGSTAANMSHARGDKIAEISSDDPR